MGQHTWSWEAAQFEKLDNAGIKTEHAASAWHVAIEPNDRAWGYRIALPEEAKPFIMWRSSIEVEWVNGMIYPGIAYMLGDEGISFQVDVTGRKVELRHVTPEDITKRVATFGAPDAETPFKLQIEFNAITKVFTGNINEKRIMHVKLPFRSLPALDEISDIEILTTTDARPGGGTVSYGALTLECE